MLLSFHFNVLFTSTCTRLFLFLLFSDVQRCQFGFFIAHTSISYFRSLITDLHQIHYLFHQMLYLFYATVKSMLNTFMGFMCWSVFISEWLNNWMLNWFLFLYSLVNTAVNYAANSSLHSCVWSVLASRDLK